MNAIQFAIASVIDTSTGYGLSRSGASVDYAAASTASRRQGANTVSDYLRRIGSAVGVALSLLRERRERQRNLRQLSNLSDHLLDDIGITRGDIIAAQLGNLSQEQFEQLRIGNRDNGRIAQHKIVSVGSQVEARDAVNEAVFANARCA